MTLKAKAKRDELLHPSHRRYFELGYLAHTEEDKQKKLDILSYCEPHLEKMWAASVVGMILDCDFRDAKEALAKYKQKNSQVDT